MLKEFGLTKEVREALHRVRELMVSAGVRRMSDLRLTLARSIALRFPLISVICADLSFLASFLADASACRLAADGVTFGCSVVNPKVRDRE